MLALSPNLELKHLSRIRCRSKAFLRLQRRKSVPLNLPVLFQFDYRDIEAHRTLIVEGMTTTGGCQYDGRRRGQEFLVSPRSVSTYINHSPLRRPSCCTRRERFVLCDRVYCNFLAKISPSNASLCFAQSHSPKLSFTATAISCSEPR